MKRFFSACIFCLCVIFASWAEEVKEYFSVGNPIEFMDEKFNLAWSSHPVDVFYIQEYLTKGENFNNYTKMFTVNIVFCDQSPEQALRDKIIELDKRKKFDPVTRYQLSKTDDDWFLTFLVSDADTTKGTGVSLVEADVHCYRTMTIDGKNAIVLLFYSARAYGDDMEKFLKAMKDNAEKWQDAIHKMNFVPEFK